MPKSVAEKMAEELIDKYGNEEAMKLADEIVSYVYSKAWGPRNAARVWGQVGAPTDA